MHGLGEHELLVFLVQFTALLAAGRRARRRRSDLRLLGARDRGRGPRGGIDLAILGVTPRYVGRRAFFGPTADRVLAAGGAARGTTRGARSGASGEETGVTVH